MTNIHGESEWEPCFVVKDVDLPTGYFLGMSAATGDLAGTQSKALTSVRIMVFISLLQITMTSSL